jgi:hypothetical protein
MASPAVSYTGITLSRFPMLVNRCSFGRDKGCAGGDSLGNEPLAVLANENRPVTELGFGFGSGCRFQLGPGMTTHLVWLPLATMFRLLSQKVTVV